MNFDDASNGIFLKNRKLGGSSSMSRHEGNHKSFSDFIESKLDIILLTYGKGGLINNV